MSRAVILLLFSLCLQGGRGDFDFIYQFDLKKDQLAVVEIKKDYPHSFKKEGILTFRWTLFHNRRLVLLLDYEGFKHQYILEPRYGRNTIEVFLTGDYKRIDRRPFMFLTFKRFNIKTKRALLVAQFSDPAKRLEIKITKPKKKPTK